MSRSSRRHGVKANLAKVRRAIALERVEFKYPSEPRKAAAGATSFPLKAEDPNLRAIIDEALARHRGQR